MRSEIHISRSNLISNYRTIKEYTKKEIIAVVKSNAYGHGLIEISRILYSQGVHFFAVASIQEAISLRSLLPLCNILCLEEPDDLNLFYLYQITCSVYSINSLKKIISSNMPLKCHIKIDTGLNRLGILEKEYDEVIKLASNSRIKVTGVFTHIASKEKYHQQEKIFKSIYEKTPHKERINFHMNSSFYIDNIPEYTKYIRIGLALYGLASNDFISLLPVLSLSSPIIRKKKVSKGDLVGYGLDGVIKENGYIYTIPLGYADGWDYRRLTIGYNETYLNQIGYTCMDYMMLFSKKDYQDNTKIEILSSHLPIIELSKIYNINIYEMTSTLSPRIRRIIDK